MCTTEQRPSAALDTMEELSESVHPGPSSTVWTAANTIAVLLRFDRGLQVIVIQTREDGVSIDQVVLSAEKPLTTRPGTAKTITRSCGDGAAVKESLTARRSR